MIHADKPHLWKADVRASVDMYNAWFMREAPTAYRMTRAKTTAIVEQALLATNDLLAISPSDLKLNPGTLLTLRAATAPPIARDRLAGLAGTTRGLVSAMESGKLPLRPGRGVG